MKRFVATLFAISLMGAAGLVSAETDTTDDDAYVENILDYND